MPGFTHFAAQPITLAANMDAYVQMLSRDAGRFADCAKRLNECPLGAALAGSPYPIDRDFTARQLGFERPMAILWTLYRRRISPMSSSLPVRRRACICRAWRRSSFGRRHSLGIFISRMRGVPGSSIMPQKKNPDAAELVRAKNWPAERQFGADANRHEGSTAGLQQGHAGG